MMRRLSLRWRLIIVGVIIPLVMLTGLLTYLGRDFARAYREARLAPARLIARQVSYTIEEVSPYITSIYDLQGLSDYLGSLASGEENITFVAVVDENGKAIYHSQPQMAMRLYPDLRGLWSGEFERHVVPYEGELHLVVRSIRLPGSRSQRLYIVVAMPAMAAGSRWFIVVPIAVSIAVFLIIVAIFYFAISRWVTMPISRLAEGAARLGAGELSYRLPDAPGELGFLARTLNGMAERLQGMIASLEDRVYERTAALMRRSQQLEAVMMVASESIRSRDVDSLLQTTVKAISNYFGFYHAGIFLLDDERRWAVLRAASSAGGARMLARGHRLRVGQQGIVGMVAATGKPRIALDVGEDAVWFNNPDLPQTRSEMALPLNDEKGRIIGVLDVQSDKPNAFGDEDVSVLQLLADQLSIALQNAELMEQTQVALQEMELLQRDYMRTGWARVMGHQRVMAFEYDRVDVRPVLPLPVDPASVREVIPSQDSVEHPFVIEPMRYRDETIGLIALSDPNRRWSEEEIALVREIGNQLSIALENARLFEEAQRTARQQALLNAVLQAAATRISPDEALRDIAEILARGLDMAVGVFTFLEPGQLQRARLQSFFAPDGESILPAGGEYELPGHLQIFLRGLERAESGKLLPLPLGEEVIERYVTSQVLYITIKTSGRLSGFLVFVQRQGHTTLSPETRDLAQNIASQVAVILENLNLLEESQRRSHELQLLYDISLRFGRELDAEAVRRLVVEQAAALVDADGVAFVTFDAATRKVLFAYARGILADMTGRSYPVGGTFTEIFQEGQAVLIEDYNTAESPFEPFRGWVSSMIGVPLVAARGGIGALVGVRRRGRFTFSEEHLRLLEMLGAQAAVAIENARLYEESTRRAEALQRLYEAGLELVSALDVQRITEIGAAWARRLLGVEIALAYYRDLVRDRFVIGLGIPEGMEDITAEMNLMPTPDGFIYQVMESDRPLIVGDLSIVPEAAEMAQHGFRSMAAVPLRLGTQPVGVLFAMSRSEGFFGEEHMRLLEFLGTQMATAIQNALYLRNMEEARALTERQARYQSGVARATTLLAEQGSEALGEVLGILAEAIGVTRAYYTQPVQNEDGSYRWEIVHRWPLTAEGEAGGLREWRPETIPDWAKALREGVGIVRATLAEAKGPERAIMERFGIKALLLLRVENQADRPPDVIGFVDLQREHRWGDDVVNAMRTMALAISGTLAREHLLRQVQAALSEAEALYRAAQALNIAVTYDDIIGVLRSYTVFGKGANYVVLQLFDRPLREGAPLPTRLRVIAVWYAEQAPAALQRSYPLRGSQLFTYVSKGEAMVIEDVEKAPPAFKQMGGNLFTALGARGAVLVPMVVAGQGIGFVSAIYPHPISISEAELTRLKILVGQASVAVQNRFQLEVTASRARRERLIRQIGERLQHAADIESLLATTAEELGKAFQARHTTIRLLTSRVSLTQTEEKKKDER